VASLILADSCCGGERRFSQKLGHPPALIHLYVPSSIDLLGYRVPRSRGKRRWEKRVSWANLKRIVLEVHKSPVIEREEAQGGGREREDYTLSGRSEKARRRGQDYDRGRLRPPPERTRSCWPRGHEKRATLGGALE